MTERKVPSHFNKFLLLWPGSCGCHYRFGYPAWVDGSGFEPDQISKGVGT